MTTHTPGPWIVEDSRKFKRKALRQNILMVVAVNGGMPGLIVNQGNVTPTDEANASLIAAAPELLAALEAITCLSVNGKQLCFRSANDIPMGMQPKLERIVRAAIKKARGA